MAPRSAHRTLALATAGLLAAAILHDAVPHEGVHTALAQVVHATPTATPPATSTPMPTNTATMTPTSMATATQTATPTQTPPQAPTSTPAATSTPSGGSGTCAVHDPNAWHGTRGPGNCLYGHEHGDAPPAWIGQAGYSSAFTGAFNTSAAENAQAPSDAMPSMTGKHPAMKGYGWTTSNGIDVYIRYHAASNVLDRMARFHSYEIFLREPNGKVSHNAGWTNSGVPSRIGDGTTGAGGRRNNCSNEVDIRPEVEVITSLAGYKTCNTTELWYFYAIGWGPTFSITIDATTITYPGEYGQLAMTNWQRTGSVGTSRGAGLTWYPPGDRSEPASKIPVLDAPFWATQFQETVSGPNDPRCTGTTTFKANPTATIHPFDADETYPNVCLPQWVSSTTGLINSQAPGRDYDPSGVRLPN